MKKFTAYISSLFLALIVLLYILDALYTFTYKHGVPRNKVSYVLSQKNKKIDYVFIGSSRVDNNIDADVIEKITGKSAINLGIQGAKLDDYFLMIQLLHKQNIKSDTIFIQVDYVFNYEGSSDIIKSNLIPYLQDDLISGYIRQRDPDFYKLKYIPFYRYLVFDYKIGFREFFNTLMGIKSNTDFKNGYYPLYGSQGVELKAELPDHIIDKNATIEAINHFALENNLKIVYFMAPYCAQTENLDFSEKLKEKIPYLIDYSREFKDCEAYFFNCTHLNDDGAKAFSSVFAFQIKEKFKPEIIDY